MNHSQRTSLVVLPVLVLLGAGVAWAGSQHGARLGPWPLFALLIAWAFVLQWVVFLPSYAARSEKFFDLTGSLTYLSTLALAMWFSPRLDGRALLLAALVAVWALRLGAFLYRRIHRAGKDERFDAIKLSTMRFLAVWTVQGLWVTLTAGAALAAITSTRRAPLDWLALVGLLLWLAGFAIEVTADAQKSRFRADPANRERFIQSGLWARSRHPNYFGEIVLWVGIALIALPALQGWQRLTLVSPLFVALLLTRISGIPLLEKKADLTWGGQTDYEAYKQRTPVLIPRW